MGSRWRYNIRASLQGRITFLFPAIYQVET